jgi:hypothetical protein
MYHGTHAENIQPILQNGFCARECQHGKPAVYFSPSIHYCAHPRYSKVYHQDQKVFFQFVLEVRINTRTVTSARIRETLSVGEAGDIDTNYPGNEGLEFVITCERDREMITRASGAVVTGIMVRKLDVDPISLRQSWWWPLWRRAETLHAWYYSPKIGCTPDRPDY